MQKSEKFFIFSWKELVVIGLLILTSVGFFFTLGLHYGKKLHPVTNEAEENVAAKLEESPEAVPPKQILDQGSQHVETAAQDALKTATQDEIKQANLKVDAPRPVELPKEKTKIEKTETKNQLESELAQTVGKSEDSTDESASPSKPLGRFAIQLGSYPSKKEAQMKIAVLNKRGLKPEIRVAEVNGETHYRVVLPGFRTKQVSDARGRELKLKRKIENFITIKSE